MTHSVTSRVQSSKRNTIFINRMESTKPILAGSSSKTKEFKKKKKSKSKYNDERDRSRERIRKKVKIKKSKKNKKRNDRSSSSSSSESEQKKKKVKKDKKEKKDKKSKTTKETNEPQAQGQVDSSDYDIPLDFMNRKAMAPESQADYEKRQNIFRRVYDEETGRERLIKGDGEVIEEIVSKSRHQEINREATKGDGNTFQRRLGLNK